MPLNSREESDYLPHNYEHNCVVYTGTHDNDTTLGWYEKLPEADKNFCDAYLNLKHCPKAELKWEFIRAAFASVADLAVIPMQDFLGKDSSARINTPSTLGNNWQWRMKEGELTRELAEEIRKITALYGRAARE